MATFRYDDNTMHYIEEGQPDAPALLYVHGTGCNAKNWSRHIRRLAGRYRCIAIDLPGHGLSEGAGYRGVGDYAFAVGALVEHLDLKAYILVGHSLGGAIAIATSTYFSERLAGLVLVDTGARLRVGPEIMDVARKAAAGEEVASLDPRWTYAKTTPDAVVEQVLADRGEVDPDLVYRDWIADDTFDFLNRMQHIAVPTLAIGGTEDPITPVRNHIFFNARMPDCELQLIENCGHWPMYEQPERFDELIGQFAERIYASG